MRSKIVIFTVLTAGALFGAVQSPAWNTTNLSQPCEQLVQATEIPQATDICTANDQAVTWGEWFSGESRSTQFHFLDFFELVFGDDNKREYKGGDYAGPKLRY